MIDSIGDDDLTIRKENLKFHATKKQRKSNNGIFIGIVSTLFIIYLLILFIAGQIQIPIICIYIVGSIAAFVAYYRDKKSAELGRRRVQENTLHLIALCGGWPGAYAAQIMLRHKTIKQPFASVFLITVFVNIFGFILYTSPTAFSAVLDLNKLI